MLTNIRMACILTEENILQYSIFISGFRVILPKATNDFKDLYNFAQLQGEINFFCDIFRLNLISYFSV